jgi:hypothetical protein
MSMTGIRIEIGERRFARHGLVSVGFILLAILFPPVVLPLLFALAIIVVLIPALAASVLVCIRESRGAPNGLSPRSPPLS